MMMTMIDEVESFRTLHFLPREAQSLVAGARDGDCGCA